MILDTTTRSVEIVLGEAVTTAAPTVCSFWADQTSGSAGFLPGDTNATTNGVTPVTVVAAPGIGTQRAVTEVRCYNADTVNHAVTLRLNDNGTIYNIETVTVAPAGTYSYAPTVPSQTNAQAALLLESGTAGLKISQLTTASKLDGTEVYPAVQSGGDVKASGNQIGFLVLSNGFITNPMDATVAGGSGTFLNIRGGNGLTTGNGGGVTITSGVGGATSGLGGGISILASDGANGTSASTFGSATISATHPTGSVGVTSGNNTGSGNTGTASLNTGSTTSGTSGNISVVSGASTTAAGVSTGNVTMGSGNATTGSSGTLTLSSGQGGTNSGAVSLRSGQTNTAGNSGTLTLATGNSTGGNSGAIAISTGTSSTAAKTSGNIVLTLGAASGGATQGTLQIVNLQTASPGVANALWKDNGVVVVSGNPVTTVASIASGAAVALTTATPVDVTTVTVANAGTYWLSGVVYFTGAAGTTITNVAGSVGTAAATLDTTVGRFGTHYLAGAAFSAIGQDISVAIIGVSVTATAGQTFHLCALANFATSTLSAYGQIEAIPIL